MSEIRQSRSYRQELEQLDTLVARMGGLAESQLECALRSLARRDTALAGRVIASDAKVDALDREIHACAVRMLALRQPVAVDLRTIVATLKISGDLERMGDYGANIAKRALALAHGSRTEPEQSLPRMGRLVQRLTHEVVDAFLERDLTKAAAVWHKDREVDDLYDGFFREVVTYMMEDARTITACTHLMFIAKNIERIGDHCTNIAETLQFLVQGGPMAGARTLVGASMGEEADGVFAARSPRPGDHEGDQQEE